MAAKKNSTGPENLILLPGEEAEVVTLPGTGEAVKPTPLPNPVGNSSAVPAPSTTPAQTAVPAPTTTAPTATATTPTATAQTSGWVPLNAVERYGSVEDYKLAMQQEKLNQIAAIQQNAALGQGATPDQVDQWWSQLTPEQQAVGGWVTDRLNNYYDEGGSKADEYLLSDEGYAVVQANKQVYGVAFGDWQAALAAGDMEAAAEAKARMDAAHLANEQIRQANGYSGGVDGSMYLTGWGENTGLAYGGGGAAAQQQSQFEYQKLLEEWRKAATEQYNATVDYEVQRAVTALERALADAEPQFREQVEGVARDELQALDNSALYAEARGDKGGIGQSQYNEIQAQAANNRLMVQQAQTKLSTDTARQIEDLRAQGEFEKADAALEIAQTYLTQLISLEQWAAEFGLTERQFAESVRQWEAEYQLAMQQFLTNQELSYAQMTGHFSNGTPTLAGLQYQSDLDLAYAQLTGQLSDGSLTLSAQGQLADMGAALLDAGIMPSSQQLSAMGMTEEQAQAYLMAMQVGKASGSGGGSGGSKGSGSGKGKDSGEEITMTLTTAKQAADAGVFNDTVLEVLRKNGYTDDMLEAIYDYVPEGSYTPIETISQLGPSAREIASVISDSYPPAVPAQMIEERLNAGLITEAEADYLLRMIRY